MISNSWNKSGGESISQKVIGKVKPDAPLKNKIAQGIVMAETEDIPPVSMKVIKKVVSDVPVLSDTLMNLLRWMSEYYVSEQGLVLKNMLPKEAYIKVKQRKKKWPPS